MSSSRRARSPVFEPALRVDHSRSSFGGPVIAAHDIGTADVQLADLARRDGATVRADQTRLDPGDQRPDGIVISRRLRPDAGDCGRAFGNAVAIAQWQTEFRLYPGL